MNTFDLVKTELDRIRPGLSTFCTPESRLAADLHLSSIDFVRLIAGLRQASGIAELQPQHLLTENGTLRTDIAVSKVCEWLLQNQ